MERLVEAASHILRNSSVLTGQVGFPRWCPTLNGCASKQASIRSRPSPGRVGCHNDDREASKRPLHHLGICRGVGNKKNPTDTTISYIRHDYIYGHHGRSWNKNSVCDYWEQVIQDKDVIITTFGAHLPEVLSNPWGGPPPGHSNSREKKVLGEDAPYNESVIADLAMKTATKFKELMKHNAVVIFISGNRGVENPSFDCTVRPTVDENPLEVSWDQTKQGYHWHNIHLSNQVYMEVFRAVLGPRCVVLDVLNLFQKMRGCRADGLHFRSDVPASPKNILWQLIYNLLREMQREGKPNEGWARGGGSREGEIVGDVKEKAEVVAPLPQMGGGGGGGVTSGISAAEEAPGGGGDQKEKKALLAELDRLRSENKDLNYEKRVTPAAPSSEYSETAE